MRLFLLLFLFFVVGSLSASDLKKLNLAHSCLQKSMVFQQQRKMDSTEFYLRKAMVLADDNEGNEIYCQAALRLASLFLYQRKFDSARFLNENVLKLSRENSWKKTEAAAYEGMGMSAFRQEKLLEGITCFQQAHQISSELGDSQGLSVSSYNLALIYSRLSDQDKALHYFREALSWSIKSGNTSLEQNIYLMMARLFRRKNRMDSANRYRLLEAKVSHTKLTGNKTASYYLSQAEDYKEHLKWTAALKNYDSALVVAAMNQDTLMQTNIIIWKAETELYRKKPETAIRLLNAIRHTTNQLRDRIDYETYYKTLVGAWKQKGRLDSALYYMQQLINANENSEVRHKQNYLMELRVKYQAGQKESEVIRLKNQVLQGELEESTRRIQMNTLLGSSFTLLLIIILLVWFFFYKQKKDKKIREKEVALLQKEKEATVAQYLLKGEENERKRIASELHDGLGVLLSSASIFITNLDEDLNPEREKNLQKARDLVDKANTEVRRISHNMMPVVLSRFGLKAALEDMVDKVSDELSVELRVKIGKGLSETMEFMIYRLTQELLNNTLKHAEASEVDIACFLQGDEIRFEYRDNGKGFDMKEAKKSRGLGLSGLRNRVEFLKGSMHIQSSPGKGVLVQVLCPNVQPGKANL
ncbi:MAG: sensor histidine kinase [Bacteroidales bacterium]|nr:sensor histidine kinase [Bacteroidales bacterium]